jgi:hypothetical protein
LETALDHRWLNFGLDPPTDPTLFTKPEVGADNRFRILPKLQFLDRHKFMQTTRPPRLCTAERQILPHSHGIHWSHTGKTKELGASKNKNMLGEDRAEANPT